MSQFAFVGVGRRRRSMLVLEVIVIFLTCLLVSEISLVLHPLIISSSAATLTWINSSLVLGVICCSSLMFSMTAVGLYNPRIREPWVGVFRRVVISVLLAGLILFSLDFITPNTKLLYSTSCLLALPTATVAILVLRFIIAKQFKINLFRWRTVVLGAGERAQIISSRMRRSADRRSFDLVAFVKIPGDKHVDLYDERCIDRMPSDLVKWAVDNNVDELVIGCDERRSELPVNALFECRNMGIKVIDILDFIERETGQVAVNLLYPSWVIYSNGFQSSYSIREGISHFASVLIALVGLIVMSPVLLLTAVAVKINDGGSILFSQIRVGQHGKLFKIYKFRSMRMDAEKNGAVWASENDDRITLIGRFIRKYRLDELPQLFNVIKGEMDLIGPRPERPEFVHHLSNKIPYYNERHNVRPGLTGWAQMQYRYGSTDEDALEKLKYDLYYIKNRSVLLDCNIFIRTLEVLLFAKGVH